MLLEPWCSRSITTSQPDLDKPVSGDLFTHFSYHNLTESSTPELCPWGNLAPLLSILVRIIGLHQHDESHLFLIFFYILVDLVKQILNTDCLGSWWTALSQHFVRLAPTGSITSRGLKGERYFRLSRFSYFLCYGCHRECLQVVIVERGCAQQSYQHQALVRGKWRTVTTVLEEVPNGISVLWSPAGRSRC